MTHLPILFAQEAAAEVTIETDKWAEQFFGLGDQQRFVLLLVALGCVTVLTIVITGIVAGVYASITRRRAEIEFKQEMLDRGMSAEEIVEVIKAAPIEDAASRWVEARASSKKAHRMR